MSARQQSRGITLIMVMIFLVLISLFSISAYKASTTNLRVTQNMAMHQEATAAAQAAIETAISTPAFQAASAAVASSQSIDVDGDGANDYTVTVTPAATCSKIRSLLNRELPRNVSTGLPQAQWIRCDSGRSGGAVGSGPSGAGLIEGGSTTGTVADASFCVETHWNVRAEVADARSATSVQVNQGVSVPYSLGDAQDRCQRNN